MIQTPTTIAGWAVWLVTVIAIGALVLLASRTFGIPIPDWFIQALFIVLIAVVIILAIQAVASIGGQ